MITYRKATTEDVRPALDFAYRVFMDLEATEIEPDALKRFEFEKDRLLQLWESGTNSMYVAADDGKIVGVMTEKGDNGQIDMLFVDRIYRRRGIATALMDHMVCDLKLRGLNRITVFSSPDELPFYQHYGFKPTGEEQRSGGLKFTQMMYIPNEIWDVLDEYGVKTGRYHERGRRMAVGDYHLIVHVWKHNGKGEWLIDRRTKRASDDIWGDTWETTGGCAVAGEDSLIAALRETKEELGIELDSAKGVLFRQFARQGESGHTYLLDVWVFEHNCVIEDVRFQASETCEAMWATPETIRKLMHDHAFYGIDVDLYFDDMAQRFAN